VSAGAPAPGGPDPATPDPGGRLLRALQVYLQFVEAGNGDARGVLHEHPDLRDLLEPMLRGRVAAFRGDDREAAADRSG